MQTGTIFSRRTSSSRRVVVDSRQIPQGSRRHCYQINRSRQRRRRCGVADCRTTRPVGVGRRCAGARRRCEAGCSQVVLVRPKSQAGRRADTGTEETRRNEGGGPVHARSRGSRDGRIRSRIGGRTGATVCDRSLLQSTETRAVQQPGRRQQRQGDFTASERRDRCRFDPAR